LSTSNNFFNFSVGYSKGKLLERIPEVHSNETLNKLHVINKRFVEPLINLDVKNLNTSLEQGNCINEDQREQEIDWGKSLLYCNIRNGQMNFNGYKNTEVYYDFELDFIMKSLYSKDSTQNNLVPELYNKAKATLTVLSNELSIENISENIDQKNVKILTQVKNIRNIKKCNGGFDEV